MSAEEMGHMGHGESSSGCEVGTNVVMLRGRLSSEPRERELPSGTLLVNWELTTSTPAGRLTAPVAWFDPPRGVRGVCSGDEVMVLGAVRRRFYRSGGATVSSTEVVGYRCARPSSKRATESLLAAAASQIGVADRARS